MFSFLKRAAVLIAGFLLIFLLIWYAGPYFAFGRFVPLETSIARLILFGAIVGIWLVKRLIRRLKAFRASDRLLEAVVAQPQPEPQRPPAEVLKLRERFDEAVSALKTGRRSGHSLYDLPWYLIIGAPGSGKTTALLNSGLKFPLEQRIGKGALRGVGGTRNCDWWFTDEAVFLDTAGRYTTQDSDASSDAAGWSEFLGLLRRYRVRRPINGVIVTVDAQQLLSGDSSARELHVESARNRLAELVSELQIQLPVYVMVTKCDLVEGFSEFFEDLGTQERAQVWGVTFPYEQTVANSAPRAFPEEFDALTARLNERVFDRIQNAGDTRRRASVFAFPQQVGAMRDPLTSWIADIFDTRAFAGHVLLRGVYFTSATQEGNPIDRLLGSIGRKFRAAGAVLRPSGPGKAYFVEDLLKQVMLGESGLAGVNRRLELRNASILLAAYTGTAVLAVLAVLGLSVSYQKNREFLEETAAHLARFEETPEAEPTSPLPAIADRLTALRAVVDVSDRYRAATSWLVSWGLYQGSSIGNAARAAYGREFDSVLLPRLGSQIQGRLLQYARDPEKLFRYLKAYLMLAQPGRAVESELIQNVADLEWRQEAGRASAVAGSLSEHTGMRLASEAPLRKLGVNANLVEQARSNLRQMDRGKVFYQSIKHNHLAGDDRGLRIDQLAGVSAEKVLRRRSGTPLSTPIPRLYTPAAFNGIKKDVATELYTQLMKDAWVWGEGPASSVANSGPVVTSVIHEYEQDYIKTWNDVLADIEIVPLTSVDEMREVFRILSDQATSPLRTLLVVVRDNTTLWQKPAPPPEPGSALEKMTKKASDALGTARKNAEDAVGIRTDDWGREVTAAFQWVHQLLGSEKAKTPLDPFLETLAQVQAHLDRIGSDLGGVPADKVASDPEFRRLLQTLERQAGELGGFNHIVDSLPGGAAAEIKKAAAAKISSEYEADVIPQCAKFVDNKYPFWNVQTDLPLEDFAAVFGPGGLFDAFFSEHLANYVDTSGARWTLGEGAPPIAERVLSQVRSARMIRDMFFPHGSKMPRVEFSLWFANLDPRVTRFFLTVEGVAADIKRGSASAKQRLSWPGNSPGFLYQFEGGTYKLPKQDGRVWAWFRLINATGTAVGGQPVRLQLRDDQGYQVDAFVEVSNATGNPFSDRTWRQFRCGA